MHDDFRFTMRSDPKLLCGSRAALRAYLERMGFPKERASEIVLAVDEACTNAIRHAYGGRTDGSLEVALRSGAEAIEIEVIDEGRPAPPEAMVRKEAKPANIEELTPGGLGVQLMYTICDDVRIDSPDGRGNRIVMRIALPPSVCGAQKLGGAGAAEG